MEVLNESEKDLIKLLREEAWQVKNCFTQYSFQALAFGSLILGLIARYQFEYPFVGLTSVLVIFLVLSVTRIGAHKYATANRNYGYQLHLERIVRLEEIGQNSRQNSIRNIGWEEAMRAWRIVQATTFENIYTHGWLSFNNPIKKTGYKWYEPKALIEKGAKWHPGSYLGNMLIVLHIVAVLSLLPLLFLCVQIRDNIIALPVVLFLTGLTSCGVIFRIYKTNSRRKMLEEGLLCIHSCAIMWHAVVVAHLRAMIVISLDHNNKLTSYKNYTKYLSALALDLNKDIMEIHAWIDMDDNEKAKTIRNKK